MTSLRKFLVVGALGLAGLACGTETEEAPPPPPPPPPPPVVAGPIFAAANGVVWRYTDNDWIVRITLDVQNSGTTPLTVARAGVTATGQGGQSMRAWSGSSTFAETANISPGQRQTGDISWYTSGSAPSPSAVNVSFGTWSASVPLVTVPISPPAATPVTGAATGAITVTSAAPGTTWRHPSDDDHIVRVDVTITNGTNIPVEIASHYLRAKAGDASGSWWSQSATITTPLVLAPGASATGALSWFFDDALPVPESVNVLIGPDENPLSTLTIPLGPGQPPG